MHFKDPDAAIAVLSETIDERDNVGYRGMLITPHCSSIRAVNRNDQADKVGMSWQKSLFKKQAWEDINTALYLDQKARLKRLTTRNSPRCGIMLTVERSGWKTAYEATQMASSTARNTLNLLRHTRMIAKMCATARESCMPHGATQKLDAEDRNRRFLPRYLMQFKGSLPG